MVGAERVREMMHGGTMTITEFPCIDSPWEGLFEGVVAQSAVEDLKCTLLLDIADRGHEMNKPRADISLPYFCLAANV